MWALRCVVACVLRRRTDGTRSVSVVRRLFSVVSLGEPAASGARIGSGPASLSWAMSVSSVKVRTAMSGAYTAIMLRVSWVMFHRSSHDGHLQIFFDDKKIEVDLFKVE